MIGLTNLTPIKKAGTSRHKGNVPRQKRALGANVEAATHEPSPLPSWDELEVECLEHGWNDLAATMRKAKRYLSPEGLEKLEREERASDEE